MLLTESNRLKEEAAAKEAAAIARKNLEQIAEVGDMIRAAPEHEYPFIGRVLARDENNVLSVQGTEVRSVNGEQVLGEEHVREVKHYDVETINGRFVMKRLQSVYGSHPEIGMLVEITTEAQLNGVEQDRILWDSLTFMSREAYKANENANNILCGVIENASKQLIRQGATSHMVQLSKLFMGDAIASHNKEGATGFVHRNILSDMRLRLALMKIDRSKLHDLLTEEGRKQLFGEDNEHNNQAS